MSLHRPVEIAPGTEVRGFVIESKLGAGGYGTVYRASRGERLYALKFLRLRDAGHWAQREVDVLMRLGHPNLVSFEGCGFWPDDSHEFFPSRTRRRAAPSSKQCSRPAGTRRTVPS